jgi:glycerol-3-phosphate dehydrogenase (NAD(P)+)
MKISPIAVIGAGAWGTALAILLARNGHKVNLWGIEQTHMQRMQAMHCNDDYLPGFAFPTLLTPYTKLEDAMQGVQDVLIVVPSYGFRDTLKALRPQLSQDARLLSATKGLDPSTGQLLHKVVAEELGKDMPLAILSGPSFAREVAQELPTAITLATQNKLLAEDALHYFHSTTFRLYTSNDLIGVQVGGIVKNIMAVAAGIADGLGFGANTRSALLTRGLAEMMRLGMAMGGQQATFMGLSGLGDLILTGTDNQSRNRRFGMALASGKDIIEAEKSLGQVVEAVHNTAQVYHLAEQFHVEMPITEQVHLVLQNKILPSEAVAALLAREPKAE